MYPNTMEANDFRVWIQQHVGPSLKIDPKTIKELISNPVTVREGQGNTTIVYYNDPSLPVTAPHIHKAGQNQEDVAFIYTNNKSNDDSTESVSVNNVTDVENAFIFPGTFVDKMEEQTKGEESQVAVTSSIDENLTKGEESQITRTLSSSSPPSVDANEAMNQNDDEAPSTAAADVVISHHYHSNPPSCHNNNTAMDNYSHHLPLLSLPATTLSQRLTNTITRISESFSSYSSWEELVIGKWFANTNTNSTFSEPSTKRVRMDNE
jgi:hypothetical protein